MPADRSRATCSLGSVFRAAFAAQRSRKARAPGWTRSRLSVMSAAIMLACPALAAQSLAVAPGLWTVQVLTTFEAVPGAQAGSGPLPAAQRRSYRVCITPALAASPVTPPPGARETELVYQPQGLSGHYVVQGSDGRTRQVEFAFHRLHEARFEGSHDAVGAALIARTQYMAERVGEACAPGVQMASGLPAQP